MTALTFPGSVPTPSSDTTCPRNFTDVDSSSHFFGLSFRFADLILSKTCLNLPMYSSNVLPNIIISSRYTKPISHWSPLVLAPSISQMFRERSTIRMASREREMVSSSSQTPFCFCLPRPFPLANIHWPSQVTRTIWILSSCLMSDRFLERDKRPLLSLISLP